MNVAEMFVLVVCIGISYIINHFLITIFIHELGHYIAAKALGIRCTFHRYKIMLYTDAETFANRPYTFITIYAMGPVINLLCAAILFFMWLRFVGHVSETKDLMLLGVVMGACISNIRGFIDNLIPWKASLSGNTDGMNILNIIRRL